MFTQDYDYELTEWFLSGISGLYITTAIWRCGKPFIQWQYITFVVHERNESEVDYHVPQKCIFDGNSLAMH